VRVGPHKLILYPAVGVIRLFDLAADPDERHDLADKPNSAPVIRDLFKTLRELQHQFADSLDLAAVYPNFISVAK
jgi:hypothetical protein